MGMQVVFSSFLQLSKLCRQALAVCFVIAFLFQPRLEAVVENSIIPIMEKYESVHNLSRQKYSQEQYSRIQDALKQKHKRIRVVTYNMLFNRFDKNLALENRWPSRLPKIVELVNEMNPDVLGTQELQSDQVKDLRPFLKRKYRFISINTSTGDQDGIFVKTDRFHILKKKFFVMTPTKTWLTTVQLKDRITGKKLAICNTHFAFTNIEDRTAQAHYVAHKAQLLAKSMPVIFMGDLNTFPNRPDMAFPALDGDYISQILTKHILQDSLYTSICGHVGPISTFTNKDPAIRPFEGTGTPGVFLDHIYVSKGIMVLMHAVQPATVDGHFPSDHMPLIIDCVSCLSKD